MINLKKNSIQFFLIWNSARPFELESGARSWHVALVVAKVQHPFTPFASSKLMQNETENQK
jgi:hypothetical protein